MLRKILHLYKVPAAQNLQQHLVCVCVKRLVLFMCVCVV